MSYMAQLEQDAWNTQSSAYHRQFRVYVNEARKLRDVDQARALEAAFDAFDAFDAYELSGAKAQAASMNPAFPNIDDMREAYETANACVKHALAVRDTLTDEAEQETWYNLSVRHNEARAKFRGIVDNLEGKPF